MPCANLFSCPQARARKGNTKRRKGKALPWRAGRGQRWRFPMLAMLRVGPVPAQGAALVPTGTPWPCAKHPKQK